MIHALKPVRTVAPATLPVTLSALKAHVRVDFTDDDDTLQTYLDAAVSHLDGYSGILGRCLVTQTWRQGFRAWQARLPLPFPDASSIVLTYSDADGAEQTVDAAMYQVIETAMGGEVVLKEAFTRPDLQPDREDPVRITFAAGYGDSDDVPAAIKAAAMMLAGHWYANREAVVTGESSAALPMGVDLLTAPFRMGRI